MDKNSSILVTGANGLVGSTLVKHLILSGFNNVHPITRNHADLRSFRQTMEVFERIKPEFVFHIAARVYGIWGNLMNKGLSFYENVKINTNVVEASRIVGVKKICAMGSGAVYPYPAASRLLNEGDLLMGEPHFAEDSYAHAKRALLAMLRAYEESYHLQWAFVVSGNLYGPGDKFDTINGHVIPSLVKKFYDKIAKKSEVIIWGDGHAQRDFLYSEDAAAALVAIMKHVDGSINLGSGQVVSILDVVRELCKISTINIAEILWDKTKPNGQNHRAYNLEKLRAIGFEVENDLSSGLKKTWDWYIKNHDV